MNIDKTQQENELINSEEGDIDRKRKIYFQQKCESINLPFFSAFQFSGNSTVKLVFKSLGTGRQVGNKIEDK